MMFKARQDRRTELIDPKGLRQLWRRPQATILARVKGLGGAVAQALRARKFRRWAVDGDYLVRGPRSSALHKGPLVVIDPKGENWRELWREYQRMTPTDQRRADLKSLGLYGWTVRQIVRQRREQALLSQLVKRMPGRRQPMAIRGLFGSSVRNGRPRYLPPKGVSTGAKP